MMMMKNFICYTPDENPYAGSGFNIAFYRDAEGRDWYESQALFAADTLKVCYRDNGVIAQYAYDVSALVPVGLSVAEVKDFHLTEDISLIDGTWVFDGANIVKRTYTAEEIRQRAESRRQDLLTAANSTISLWQTEVALGSISDADKASLIKWIVYIKALNAMNLSHIDDEDAYNAIVWPEVPENVA